MSVFALIFFTGAFLLAAAWSATAFLFADFLGAFRFCIGFTGAFLPALFPEFVDFFLDFLLVAIRAV
jgi:hypothetical protein